MDSTMRPALKHAKCLAREMNKCNRRYIIHIALKELGMPSSQDGFPLAKSTIQILCENPFCRLRDGAYTAAGILSDPPMDNEQVDQAIRRAIKAAWNNRNEKMWKYYFPESSSGKMTCPSNRDFLTAVADFVELWQGFCEEVNYAG